MTTPGADSFPRADPDAPFAVPEKKINSEADVVRFQRSVGFARFMAFIELLNVAVKGKTCLDEDIPSNPTISRLIELLDVLNGLVDEFPPSTGPRRFGNVAFRTWMGTLDEVPKIRCVEGSSFSRERQRCYGSIFPQSATLHLLKYHRILLADLDRASVWTMGRDMNFHLPPFCVLYFYYGYWIPQRTLSLLLS
jgi:hypothetical protein